MKLVKSIEKELMLNKLYEAQALLSDVYHFAQGYELTNSVDQMSCADSCIIDALSDIERNFSV